MTRPSRWRKSITGKSPEITRCGRRMESCPGGSGFTGLPTSGPCSIMSWTTCETTGKGGQASWTLKNFASDSSRLGRTAISCSLTACTRPGHHLPAGAPAVRGPNATPCLGRISVRQRGRPTRLRNWASSFQELGQESVPRPSSHPLSVNASTSTSIRPRAGARRPFAAARFPSRRAAEFARRNSPHPPPTEEHATLRAPRHPRLACSAAPHLHRPVAGRARHSGGPSLHGGRTGAALAAADRRGGAERP